MKQKIINLQAKLAQGLIGREETVKTALLSVLAGENILLIGPPGTGKSMVSRRISQALAPQSGVSPYFEYLLTKFSTPEELFGPLSISALKQDRFERKTEGYLPDVQVAFLDEIFKASSSILNSLLTILNERKFHNGVSARDIPLQALVAASNELPKGQAELAALYDRFLLRCFVGYLNQEGLSRLFALPEAAHIGADEQFTAAELAHIQQQARSVVFPDRIQAVLRKIWQQHADTFKEHADEQLSDRRFVKILNLLRVSAATNGRSEVDLSDVMLLKDCLWNNDENREKVMGLLTKVLQRYDKMVEVGADAAIPSENRAGKKAANKHIAAKGSVIKGYQGSGSEHDPILIGNFSELMGLQRAEVGQQGYYFRQTADIDCSAAGDTWVTIAFKGRYDGGGHRIVKQDKAFFLFSELQAESEVHDLRLEGLALCSGAKSSVIKSCHTNGNVNLVGGMIIGSKIWNCHAGGNLVAGTVSDKSHIAHSSAGSSIAWGLNNSMVECCRSGSFLIRGDILQQSVVRNCCVDMDKKQQHTLLEREFEIHMGMIGKSICHSLVDNVYIHGEIGLSVRIEREQSGRQSSGLFGGSIPTVFWGKYFSGIAPYAEKSSIQGVAVGSVVGLVASSSSHSIDERRGRAYIIDEGKHNFYKRNAIINSNQWGSDSTGAQPLSPTMFDRYYCEHTLGWDFDTVWAWDDKENRPVLQPYGGQDITQAARPKQAAGKQSMLQQQMAANIWL